MTARGISSQPAGSDSRPTVPAPILAGRVIAVGRRLGPDEALRIGEALAAGGVRAYEVTLQGDGALEAIAALARRFDPGDLAVTAPPREPDSPRPASPATGPSGGPPESLP